MTTLREQILKAAAFEEPAPTTENLLNTIRAIVRETNSAADIQVFGFAGIALEKLKARDARLQPLLEKLADAVEAFARFEGSCECPTHDECVKLQDQWKCFACTREDELAALRAQLSEDGK